jgi:REP element-mobilizing transposase RayT
MQGKPQKYKAIQHYHQAGDCHELTFSCYQRLPLLTNDCWRQDLAESIDKGLRAHGLNLSAFVYMPEHVHLLVWPKDPACAAISAFLKTLKQSCSTKVKHRLKVTSRQHGQNTLPQCDHGQTALARATHPPPESWRMDSSANGTGEMRHPVAFVCQFDRFFAGQTILPVFRSSCKTLHHSDLLCDRTIWRAGCF